MVAASIATQPLQKGTDIAVAQNTSQEKMSVQLLFLRERSIELIRMVTACAI